MDVITKTDTAMHRTASAPKRSGYPLSAILILIVHLGLGYVLYQYVAKPAPAASTSEPTTIATSTPAVP